MHRHVSNHSYECSVIVIALRSAPHALLQPVCDVVGCFVRHRVWVWREWWECEPSVMRA
jgi:hypothetical protein